MFSFHWIVFFQSIWNSNGSSSEILISRNRTINALSLFPLSTYFVTYLIFYLRKQIIVTLCSLNCLNKVLKLRTDYFIYIRILQNNIIESFWGRILVLNKLILIFKMWIFLFEWQIWKGYLWYIFDSVLHTCI